MDELTIAQAIVDGTDWIGIAIIIAAIIRGIMSK